MRGRGVAVVAVVAFGMLLAVPAIAQSNDSVVADILQDPGWTLQAPATLDRTAVFAEATGDGIPTAADDGALTLTGWQIRVFALPEEVSDLSAVLVPGTETAGPFLYSGPPPENTVPTDELVVVVVESTSLLAGCDNRFRELAVVANRPGVAAVSLPALPGNPFVGADLAMAIVAENCELRIVYSENTANGPAQFSSPIAALFRDDGETATAVFIGSGARITDGSELRVAASQFDVADPTETAYAQTTDWEPKAQPEVIEFLLVPFDGANIASVGGVLGTVPPPAEEPAPEEPAEGSTQTPTEDTAVAPPVTDEPPAEQPPVGEGAAEPTPAEPAVTEVVPETDGGGIGPVVVIGGVVLGVVVVGGVVYLVVRRRPEETSATDRGPAPAQDIVVTAEAPVLADGDVEPLQGRNFDKALIEDTISVPTARNPWEVLGLVPSAPGSRPRQVQFFIHYGHSDQGDEAAAETEPNSAWGQGPNSPIFEIEDQHIFGSDTVLRSKFGYVGGGFELRAQPLRAKPAEPGSEGIGSEAAAKWAENSSDYEFLVDWTRFLSTGDIDHDFSFGWSPSDWPLPDPDHIEAIPADAGPFGADAAVLAWSTPDGPVLGFAGPKGWTDWGGGLAVRWDNADPDADGPAGLLLVGMSTDWQPDIVISSGVGFRRDDGEEGSAIEFRDGADLVLMPLNAPPVNEEGEFGEVIFGGANWQAELRAAYTLPFGLDAGQEESPRVGYSTGFEVGDPAPEEAGEGLPPADSAANPDIADADPPLSSDVAVAAATPQLGPAAVEIGVDVFNLFNSDTGLHRRRATLSSFSAPVEVLGPRLIRFGGRVTF